MNGKGIKKNGNGSAPEGYAVTALVLQGGGALGSYQAGVYEGLAEAGIHPNWVAGISIGSLNAAVIAGNPRDKRVERLRAFWEHICRQPWWPPLPHARFLPGCQWPDSWRGWINTLEATRAFVEGQNGFFVPRSWTSLAWAQTAPHTASFYDTRPLKATLERFADFDRINRADEMRVSIGVVNVESGNFRYFDNLEDRLRPEHFMASGRTAAGLPGD
jgi:NTE family protein